MGADWYEPIIFFGITFPLENVKALDKAVKKGIFGDCPYEVVLYEGCKHSRCEGEEISDLLERCEGFFGLVNTSAYSLAELVEYEKEFNKFVAMNIEKLTKHGVKGVGSLMAGFVHEEIEDYLVDEDDDEEDDKEDEDDDEENDEKDDEEDDKEDEDREDNGGGAGGLYCIGVESQCCEHCKVILPRTCASGGLDFGGAHLVHGKLVRSCGSCYYKY